MANYKNRSKSEEKYDSPWSYDYDVFLEFAKYLAQKRDKGEIEILSTKEAYLR